MSCSILVNAKWRFVSEKENLHLKNVWGAEKSGKKNLVKSSHSSGEN